MLLLFVGSSDVCVPIYGVMVYCVCVWYLGRQTYQQGYCQYHRHQENHAVYRYSLNYVIKSNLLNNML